MNNAAVPQVARRPGAVVVDQLLDEICDMASNLDQRTEARLLPLLTEDFPRNDECRLDEGVSPLFDGLRGKLLLIHSSLQNIHHTLDRVDL